MKRTLATIATALVFGAPASAENTDMITACTQTVYDYAWHLDHPADDLDETAAQFAALFTEDAVLRLANARLEQETFVGPDEIASRYIQGRDTTRFLHLMTNVRINPTSATEATGTSYVEIYIHPIGGGLDQQGGVTGVAEYRDEYRYEDGVCRISNRYANLRLLSLQNVIQDPIPE